MLRGDLVHPFSSCDEQEKGPSEEKVTGLRTLCGDDTQVLLNEVSKMLNQCQETCMSGINEGIALQTEALERIDEVYHLYSDSKHTRPASKKYGGASNERVPSIPTAASCGTKGHGSMLKKCSMGVRGHSLILHKGSIVHGKKGSLPPIKHGHGEHHHHHHHHHGEHGEHHHHRHGEHGEHHHHHGDHGEHGAIHHGRRHTFLMCPLTGTNAPLVDSHSVQETDGKGSPPTNVRDTFANGSQSMPLPILPSIASFETCDEHDKDQGRKECSDNVVAKGSARKQVAIFCEDEDKDENREAEDGDDGIAEKMRSNRTLKSIAKQVTKELIISRKTKPAHPIRKTKQYGSKFFGYTTIEGMIVRLVNHSAFDICSGLLIIVNTALIGVETDHMAKHDGSTARIYEHSRTAFFVLFSLELLFRILAQGRDFIVSSDRGWNIFDTIMVLSSATEFCFQFLDTTMTNTGSATTGRVLRILRIVRITRAMRIGRILRYARTFRQIAYSLQSSMGTLFWAMVMIFLVVYCFAISFCQAATDHLVEVQLEAAYLVNMKNQYGSVLDSLFSLYKAMTGGQNWGEVVAPLLHVGWFNVALFLGFISLTFFGVLNVVTAIFVDSAMQSQQHYKDLLIQENIAKKQLYSSHLREVFLQIDKDDDGCINAAEMEHFLCDPDLNLYLESIDIFPNDARGLFRLLDRDDSGSVSIDEFCEGCLRLKGEAKAFDIHCLIHNVEKSHQRIEDIVDYLNDMGVVMGYSDSEVLY